MIKKSNTYRKIIYLLVCSLGLTASSYSQSGWIMEEIGTRNYVATNFINDSTGFIFGDDGVILRSNNRGLNWQLGSSSSFSLPVKNGLAFNGILFSVISGGTASGMVYTSSNGGSNWISGIHDIVPVGNGFIWLRGLTFLNENTGYVCGNNYGTIGPSFYVDGIVYKTTNSGLNWFQSLRSGVDYYDIKFKDDQNGALRGGGFLKTSDSGITWEYTSGLPGYDGKFTDPFKDTIYTTDTRGIVIGSTNMGNSFHDIVTNNTKPLRNLFFIDAKRGYVVGDSGLILFTTNAGENWTTQASHTTQNLRGIWFLGKDTGLVVGDSGIILRTYTAGIMTGINQQKSEIPIKFILYQNYPNPFNPTTKISYSLPNPQYTILKVYDVLGNEIATLVNKKQNEGNYSVEWDASNYPSGVYFYNLEIDGRILGTKKMLLLK